MNSIMKANRARGLRTKYRARIEHVGKSDERIVLMMFATAMRLASS